MTLEQFITYLQDLLERREVPENTRLFLVDVIKPGQTSQNFNVIIDDHGFSLFNTG